MKNMDNGGAEVTLGWPQHWELLMRNWLIEIVVLWEGRFSKAQDKRWFT